MKLVVRNKNIFQNFQLQPNVVNKEIIVKKIKLKENFKTPTGLSTYFEFYLFY
jgi:hypothetical protein